MLGPQYRDPPYPDAIATVPLEPDGRTSTEAKQASEALVSLEPAEPTSSPLPIISIAQA